MNIKAKRESYNYKLKNFLRHHLIDASTPGQRADASDVGCLTASAPECPPSEVKIERGGLGKQNTGEDLKQGKNLREEVHGIAALLDAFLPVLHEVSQGKQGVINNGNLVFGRPGFHGYKDDASVELFLVDLDTLKYAAN